MTGARYPTLWITAAATAVGLALLGSLALAGWPGQRNGCFAGDHPVCFCETRRSGPVAQPANTFSNFGFVAVGFAIAVSVDRRRRLSPAPPQDNPVTRTLFYPTCFAVVTALLGPGSMALHGSMTVWGGKVDVASMYLYASLLIAYGAMRLWRLPPGPFLALFLGLSVSLVLGQLTLPLPVEPLFGTLLAIATAIEWRIGRAAPWHTVDRRFALAAAACFGLAFAIWLPSLSGGAWCDPGSWLQGHAVWHLLCATAAGCLFLYYRSERT